MYQEIKEIVLKIMNEETLARSNDKYLIYRVLQVLNLPTDLEDLINLDISFETITRARRRWQEVFPELRGNERVRRKRKKLYDEIKADALGIEV